MALKFRKEALEALSSAEDLDEAIRVTSPASWVAAAVFVFAAAVAGVWSIFGTIVVRVEGPALLAYADAEVTEVVASGDGLLAELLVEQGNVVEAGEIIARIEDPALVARLEQERVILAEIEAALVDIGRQRDSDLAEYDRLAGVKRNALGSRLADSRLQEAAYRDRLENTLSLQRTGIATNPAVNAARAELHGITREIGAIEAEVIELDLQREDRLNRWRLRLVDEGSRLSQQRARVRELEKELALTEHVLAPVAGEIDQVLVAPGTFIRPGTQIASIVGPPNPALEALGFFAAGDAQTIEPGMGVQVSPASAPREEAGAILGVVVEVSRFPVSSAALSARLQNEDLVEAFTQSGPPLLVTVALERDAEGSLRWSGSDGPGVAVTAGSLATAAVAVRERPPISFVLPALRQWAGLGG